MKLNIQLLGGRGATSSTTKSTQTKTKPSLGTVAGKEIRYFRVYGAETGDYGKEFTSLKDVYNAVQETKKWTREEFGYSDDVTVEIGTDDTIYTGYQIRKYKGRYKLK